MAQRLADVMTDDPVAVPASPPLGDTARSSADPRVETVVLTQVVLTRGQRGRDVATGRDLRAGGLPEGLEAECATFHSVTPRIVVGDVTAGVEFLRAVFDAAGEVHVDRPAEIRIGDSIVMVTAGGKRELFPTFLYVYVDDADRAFRRALAAGAVSLEDPVDAPYGDRRAMVRDPSGNVFQIAHRRM
jgi:uncharacterized glyoxalase superfamily protein PhnB